LKLKVDENGAVVVRDGMPVYVHDDGKEVAFDAKSAISTIKRVSDERDSLRKESEKLKGSLEQWTTALGEITPEDARGAVDTVALMDEKQLLDASGVEKLKAEVSSAWEQKFAKASKTWEEKVAEREAALKAKEGTIYKLLVSRKFDTSDFLTKQVNLIPEAAEALFGPRFSVEGEQVVGRDGDGNVIYSREKPGEVAEFDEALFSMILAHPRRDDLLLRDEAVGSGAGDQSKPSASQFLGRTRKSMTPREKSEFIDKHGGAKFRSLPEG